MSLDADNAIKTNITDESITFWNTNSYLSFGYFDVNPALIMYDNSNCQLLLSNSNTGGIFSIY